jgi:hypothetical protein
MNYDPTEQYISLLRLNASDQMSAFHPKLPLGWKCLLSTQSRRYAASSCAKASPLSRTLRMIPIF